MKSRILIVSAVVLLALASVAAAASGPSAAKVNGIDIPKKVLDEAVEAAKAQYKMSGRPIPDAEVGTLKRGILDDLIAVELLYQDAQKKKTTASKEQIDEFYAKLKGQFPSEAAFEETMKTKGVTTAEIRDNLGRQISISNLMKKEIDPKLKVGDAALQDFYKSNAASFREPDTVNASHILIKVDAAADEKTRAAARKKAEGLQKEAKSGKDFAELAKKNSDDPGSKDKGGLLGDFKAGDMVKPFSDAVFALQKGGISDVVETQFGYHVIKLHEKKAARTLPFAEVKKDIESYLKQKQADELGKAFVEKLREGAKVQVFL